jgi:outer membrane receptor protein involved in Fe transport
VSLEKYFANNGVASVGFFRKNIKDFFGAVTTDATPEALAELGLSDEYLEYEIRTRRNVGTARISGVEVNFRQALTFLPQWARGIQVFANGTYNDLDGNQDADFTNFATRTANWGVSLTRPRYAVKLNWNSNDDIRNQLQGANALRPEGTYFWIPRRTTVDASFELRLHRRFSVFGTARNLMDRRVLRDSFAADTPAYARNNRYLKVGSFISIGIKGEF